jgi:hypothetical protein
MGGTLLAANPAAQKILGHNWDQLIELVAFDPRWRVIHEDGQDFTAEEQ